MDKQMNKPGPEQTLDLDDCWNRIGVWSKDQSSCPELEKHIHCRNCSRYSEAGRQILERPAPGKYRVELRQRYSESGPALKKAENSALIFRLGDEWLALNSRDVNEITELRTIHSLPHRNNDLIKGLVNIRGELKICISLGSLLQLDRARDSYVTDHEIRERMIYISRDGHSFVFPVSEVYGIAHYPEQDVEPTPATVSKARQSFTSGILPWEKRHVGILDSELLFYALGKGLQ